MKYDEFLRLVIHRAGLASKDEASAATQATLEVLGQRLFGGEARDLASQLPTELQPYLQRMRLTENFGVEEFVNRVAEKEGVTPQIAARHARGVISVVMDAVTPGEMADVLAQLPQEYDTLFTMDSDIPNWRSRAA